MVILLLTILPGFAQQGETVVFKFSARNDMFFQHGNEAELERLYHFIGQHRNEIASGQMPVHVDSYCTSFDNRRDNLKTAAVRANRVKSELIVKKGLKEENFITAAHAENQEDGKKEVVVVSFLFKETKAAGQSKPEQKPQSPPQPEPEKKPATPPAQPVEKPQSEPGQQPAIPAVAEADYEKFSIRTNLLYWAVATPNLGIEYKLAENFGILVNGLWSHWIWSSEDNHHRTWMVSPEVRYYIGANKNWFIGIEGHIAEFNFKFRDTGYQGDAIGGGLTGGYKLKLSRVFDLDFSLGLGYTQLKYDTYYRSREVMVLKEGGLKKDFFGPTQLGVSLIFKL